eukprot:8935901-Lingulodinium_polyedra.AAC.1
MGVSKADVIIVDSLVHVNSISHDAPIKLWVLAFVVCCGKTVVETRSWGSGGNLWFKSAQQFKAAFLAKGEFDIQVGAELRGKHPNFYKAVEVICSKSQGRWVLVSGGDAAHRKQATPVKLNSQIEAA